MPIDGIILGCGASGAAGGNDGGCGGCGGGGGGSATPRDASCELVASGSGFPLIIP
ncbi:unnamed protein product [Gongylonema pulchrum]|uniref:Uncharacterized protein n=1 Tax=Gongylonema pulchrum TaxID=637853 RepID=A0A183DHI4_9BILA|nr:unnamed protein product [Gongylonema pulchrum]